MSKKKILVCNQTDKFWGGEVSLEKLLIGLNDHYQIYFLTPGGILAKKVRGEINVINSKGLGQLDRSRNRLWLFKLLRQFIMSFFEVFFYIILLKPNVIHCFSETAAFYAVLPSRLLGKKIICQVHLILSKSSFWGKMSLFIGLFVDHYIVVSKAVKKRMVEIGHDKKKISVLYSGTDSDNLFNPLKVSKGLFRSKFRFLSSTRLIGLIGSLSPLKGQHIFIKAISVLKKNKQIPKDGKFLIIGSTLDDKYFGELKNIVETNDLKDDVIFINKVDYEFIPNILKDLDVFVFSSCLPDAFPRSVVEAMAMEKIIIASNIGGVREQIEDGVTGILYNSEDVQELVQKLIHVNNTHQQMKVMGLKAREYVIQNLSDKVYRKNLITSYNELYS